MEKNVSVEGLDMAVRVLHVVTYMGRGGLETMLMNYYRNIDRAKVQFDFLTHRSFEADYDQEIQKLGGKIYHLPKLNPFSRQYLYELNKFFSIHQEYKIVHSHLDCMAGIPLKYAEINGIPVRIAHAHNTRQTKDKKYLLKLFYKRNITRYATKLFACSEDAGKWMFQGASFQVLNNAIDAKKYAFNPDVRNGIRKEFSLDKNTLVVGHVGRFMPQKNHGFILEIFSELVKLHPSSVLFLVGEGDLEEETKKRASELQIAEKVIFAGVRNDVEKILQAMDIFVLPSLYEGLGIVAVEAQAAGLPCIISDRVPLECERTKGLVHQISLQEDASVWAKKICALSSVERIDRSSEIIETNYDIKDNALKLEQLYLHLWRDS